MINTVGANADHGRDFHPLVDHMTKLHKRASMLQWIPEVGLIFRKMILK